MVNHITSKLFVLDHRELAFLQKISRAVALIVKQNFSFVTTCQRDARNKLQERLDHAAQVLA